MGVADRLLAVDQSVGGLNTAPDYRPLAETAMNGGVAISPSSSIPSAYGQRTPTDVLGRYAGALQLATADGSTDGRQLAGDLALSRLRPLDAAVQQFSSMSPVLQAPSKGGSSGIFGDIGHAIGDVTGAVTAPFKGVLHASDWLYTNAISQPLATTLILMSDGSQWKGGNGNLITGLAKMLHPENWAKAAQLREQNHLSPGQAFFLAYSTDDIFDQSQIAKSMNSPWFHLASGLIDAGLQWELNPLQIAGGAVSEFGKARWFAPETFAQSDGLWSGLRNAVTGGAKAASEVYSPAQEAVNAAEKAGAFDNFGHTILSIKDEAAKALDDAGLLTHKTINAQVGAMTGAVDTSGFGADLGSKWDEVVAKVGDYSPDADKIRSVASAKLKEKMFSTSPLGGFMANGIVDAENADQVKAFISAGLGAPSGMQALDQLRPDMYSRMLSYKESLAYLNDLSSNDHVLANHDLMNMVDQVKTGVGSELDRLNSRLSFIDQLSLDASDKAGSLAGSLEQFPHQSIASRIKENTVGYLQGGPFDRLVRLVSIPVPKNVIKVNMAEGELRFENLLRYMGGHSDTERQLLTGQFAAAEQGGRMELVQQAQEDAFKRLAKQTGFHSDDINTFTQSMRDSAGAADRWRTQQLFDPSNRDIIQYVNDDGTASAFHAPMYLAQTDNTAHVYNWQGIHSEMSKAGQYFDRNPGVKRIADLPGDIVDGFHQLWKPAALINPRVPTRIIALDESLYTLSKIHSVADALYMTKVYGAQVKNLAEHYTSLLGLSHSAAIEKAATEVGAVDPQGMVDVAAMIKAGRDPEAIARNAKMKGLWAGALGGAGVGYVAGGPTGALAGAGVGGGLGAALSNLERAGVPNFKVSGHDYQSVVTADPDYRRAVEAEIKQGKQMSFIERSTNAYQDQFRATGDWGLKPAGTKEWSRDVERVLNFQMGQDPLMRQLLNGSSDKEIVDWLQATDHGQSYIRQLPFKQGLVSDRAGAYAYVGDLRDHMEELTVGNAGIKNAALNKSATGQMLIDAVEGDVTKLPAVHGQIFAQVQGNAHILNSLKGAIDKGFEHIVGAPIDELSRVPGAAAAYKAEMTRRLTALGEGYKLSVDELTGLERGARTHVLDEMRRSFYNAGDRTDLQYILRGLVPFLPATSEAIKRATMISVDSPVYAAKVVSAWRGLSKVDFNIPGIGVAAVHDKDEDGNDVIRFKVPSWAAGLTKASPFFSGAFDTTNEMTLDKKTLNMFGNGLFGAGPLVQLAASEIQKQIPSTEASLKFLTPYGPNTSIVDTLNPVSAKRLNASFTNDQDSAGYRATYLMIFGAKMAKMQLGEIPKADMDSELGRNAFLDGVTKEAQALYHLKNAVNFFSPGTINAVSPFQPLIDLYRQIQSNPAAYKNKLADGTPDPADDRGADDIFYDMAGTEYTATAKRMGLISDDPTEQQTFQDAMYWLTSRSTVNNEGLPATVQAVAARDKYSDLIDAYPKLASFIAGSEATPDGAQFSSAAYDHQLSTRSGNSGKNQRTKLAPMDILNDTEKSRGWLEYTRGMDQIDSLLIERQAAGGSASLTAARNKDLATLKRSMTISIGQRLPGWWEDYNTHDDLKNQNTIDGLKAVASSPVFANADATRPEMPALREYLSAYDTVKNALQQRKAAGHSGALNSAVNRDLNTLWDSITADLLERSTDFAPVYHRYLENIPPTVDPLETQAA